MDHRPAYLAYLIICVILKNLRAELVGAILLPHGDFAYDPNLFPPNTTERLLSKKIAAASRRAGRWIVKEAKPDRILLSTPHAIKLDNDFALYMANKGSGYATIGVDLQSNSTSKRYNVTLDIELDLDMSNDLLSIFQNANVSGIYSYNDDTPITLNWGEIIPLLLLPKKHPTYKHMIWTHPHRRYEHSPDMVMELLLLGNRFARWAEGRPERIAVIISGDLSHTHQEQGPYGYSNSSALFDEALGRWAENPCEHSEYLLNVAKRLQPSALSCGFTGYALWHGMMMCSSSKRKTYQSRVLANLNVTYYGMMAAIFSPSTQTENNIKQQQTLAAVSKK